LNEIVWFNRRSQGRHSADQIRKTINMRQFLAMNQLRVIQNYLIWFVEEILTMSLILSTKDYFQLIQKIFGKIPLACFTAFAKQM
jgi:hypothetical protein